MEGMKNMISSEIPNGTEVHSAFEIFKARKRDT